MNRFALKSKPDANQSEIVGWYEELFCSVVNLSGVGGGVSDLLIGVSGITALAEVKTDHGHLEPAQIEFIASWRGAKPVVVRTKADVINHVLNLRERASRSNKHVDRFNYGSGPK